MIDDYEEEARGPQFSPMFEAEAADDIDGERGKDISKPTEEVARECPSCFRHYHAKEDFEEDPAKVICNICMAERRAPKLPPFKTNSPYQGS